MNRTLIKIGWQNIPENAPHARTQYKNTSDATILNVFAGPNFVLTAWKNGISAIKLFQKNVYPRIPTTKYRYPRVYKICIT